ncbi:SLC13 family permease [bacterium]|nr:SLC13 family permease [bacterium]
MDHIYVFITLIIVIGLFVWGKVRHDLVALIALLALSVLGIIPAEKAFSGFGHPAVITVAAVLIIGKALENSGLIDVLGKWVSRVGDNITIQILTLSLLVAVSSAFMNNVGALAILMPVALNMAKRSGNSPSSLLMPLAFASLLGGMTTMIGTPPNIIIATFRAGETGETFGMFDFSPVGVGLVLSGLLFITLAGWRLLPKRSGKKSQTESFQIDDYITEVKVTKNSKICGLTIGELNASLKADVQILGLVRKKKRIHAPGDDEGLISNDIIILESDTDSLKTFVDDTGVELVGGKKFRKDAVGSKDINIDEVVVMPDSPLTGQTASGIKIRTRYGVNLLAVSRRDKQIHKRLDHIAFRAGDVIMLQGRSQTIDDAIKAMGCLPLAPRGLRIGFQKRILLSLTIFITSIVLIIIGLLPVHIAFTLAALGVTLTGLLPLKEIYDSIDWTVIVLLGAMIPVGTALETTGGADLMANILMNLGNNSPPWLLLALILIITMMLSDVINNAATVVLMAPIAINVAQGMGFSSDPFLMAVAVGGSCAFLTPIGHQSNTLVMGPGGYKFSDYLRMGLLLELIILLIGIPLILFFWPL